MWDVNITGIQVRNCSIITKWISKFCHSAFSPMKKANRYRKKTSQNLKWPHFYYIIINTVIITDMNDEW